MTKPSEKQAALHRVKQALKLAVSPNPNEAAALRKAQQWMEKYNITQSELDAADISQTETPANVKQTPTVWETNLAGLCADAFACQFFFSQGYGKSHRGRWLFIGSDTSHQLAAYAFSVLLKQLKQARATHHASLHKNCLPKTKTARADTYAEGWIVGARKTVQTLNPSERTINAISAYKAQNFTQINAKHARDINKCPTGRQNPPLPDLQMASRHGYTNP